MGEPEALADDELLLDAQVPHHFFRTQHLDQVALLQEHVVSVLVLVSVHGEDLVIQLGKQVPLH